MPLSLSFSSPHDYAKHQPSFSFFRRLNIFFLLPIFFLFFSLCRLRHRIATFDFFSYSSMRRTSVGLTYLSSSSIVTFCDGVEACAETCSVMTRNFLVRSFFLSFFLISFSSFPSSLSFAFFPSFLIFMQINDSDRRIEQLPMESSKDLCFDFIDRSIEHFQLVSFEFLLY